MVEDEVDEGAFDVVEPEREVTDARRLELSDGCAHEAGSGGWRGLALGVYGRQERTRT